jgi:hypothetical protein
MVLLSLTSFYQLSHNAVHVDTCLQKSLSYVGSFCVAVLDLVFLYAIKKDEQ